MMESVLQLYGLVMVILPVYTFMSLRKRLRHEQMTRLAALRRYAGWVIAPVAVCACVLGLALGIEALTPYDVVSDAIVQSYVLAMVLGVLIVLLGTVVFALSMLFVQRAPKPGLQRY